MTATASLLVTTAPFQPVPDGGEAYRNSGFPQYMRPRELAARLGVREKTIAQWRIDGTGPAFLKPSERVVIYEGRTVSDWLEQARRTSTSATP